MKQQLAIVGTPRLGKSSPSRRHERQSRRKLGIKTVAAAGAAALVFLGFVGGIVTEKTVIEGKAAMEMDSYEVKDIPLKCSSKVIAMSGAKVSGHTIYNVVDIFSVQTGSANVNKEFASQWGECTPGNKAETPAYIRKNSATGKVKSVAVSIPTPSPEFVGIADLSINQYIGAPTGTSEAQIKALRAKFIAESIANHIPSYNGESNTSGAMTTMATADSTIEFARQEAIIADYIQAPPKYAEQKIMNDERKYVIAEEQAIYPGAKITTTTAPLQSSMEATINGLKALNYQTDTKYLFNNIHFANVSGQTELFLSGNNLSGSITLQDEHLTESNVAKLNQFVPSIHHL
jgi:hypothetical protein